MGFSFLVFLALPLAVSPAPKAKTLGDQSIHVEGRLICGQDAMVGYEILLREYDFPDPDDTLATTSSGSQGFFSVSGHHSELFGIEPYIRVKHNCAAKDPQEAYRLMRKRFTSVFQKCYRLSDYYVPKDAVEQGYYNYGEIPLRAEASTDELHCD